MNPWHDVEINVDDLNQLDCIIEIPMGCKVKYELDKKTGLIKVDRILFSPVHYPYNYGLIPQTYCDDGDPLDIMVIGQASVVPLAIMRVRPIGVLKMLDQGKKDDKIISIHLDDPEFNYIQSFIQLPTHRTREIYDFFEHYKKLENKNVTISSIGYEEDAYQTIKNAARLYQLKFKKGKKNHELYPSI